MQKKWLIQESAPESFIEEHKDLHLHPVVSSLLWNRDIRKVEDIQAFLEPSFDTHIHDPFLFSQMQIAVERIVRALREGQRVLVFGDYDADGITGSATVITAIRKAYEVLGLDGGLDLQSYIPHRDKEGYGLQMSQVEKFIDEKIDLVITVDCGISCVAEVADLKLAGIDTIIVDHHQFGDALPDGVLIHPSIPGETYPFKLLAAVGVAWKLACGLIGYLRTECDCEIPDGYEKWLLDFVSIATVTDIVPLVGENRVLETYGLIVLNKTKRPGFQALFRRAGLVQGSINARDVGFAIGPRLNAPSRMDHASVGLKLLLSETDEEADFYAGDIERLNRERQDATKVMMKEADEILESFSNTDPAYVLWRHDWSPALVGLVAGRVADRFGAPVVAIGKHGAQWIGSGRSYPYYDITEAVKRAGEGLLTRSGGHVQACGFALEDDEYVPLFAERLRQDAAEQIQEGDNGPSLEIHAEIPLAHADWKLTGMLDAFEPFGAQNPHPVFMTSRVEVVTSCTVGKLGKHLRFVGRHQGVSRTFIGFNFGHRVEEAMHGCHIDVVYTVSINEWNGRRDLQCKVVDFRSSSGVIPDSGLRIPD